jgi:hypothetical protein
MTASVNINGVVVTNARSMSIKNGVITVDGKEIDTKDAKQITIEVVGDLKDLNADVIERITVHGNVDTVKTMSGDIDVEGNVDGNVNSMSGDIKVGGTVSGNVSTMSGDIRHR